MKRLFMTLALATTLIMAPSCGEQLNLDGFLDGMPTEDEQSDGKDDETPEEELVVAERAAVKSITVSARYGIDEVYDFEYNLDGDITHIKHTFSDSVYYSIDEVYDLYYGEPGEILVFYSQQTGSNEILVNKDSRLILDSLGRVICEESNGESISYTYSKDSMLESLDKSRMVNDEQYDSYAKCNYTWSNSSCAIAQFDQDEYGIARYNYDSDYKTSTNIDLSALMDVTSTKYAGGLSSHLRFIPNLLGAEYAQDGLLTRVREYDNDGVCTLWRDITYTYDDDGYLIQAEATPLDAEFIDIRVYDITYVK